MAGNPVGNYGYPNRCPLDLLVKEAAVVVAVAELLETLAEVEDLKAPVVPRCQEVRHLDREKYSDDFEKEREREREIAREIERERDI